MSKTRNFLTGALVGLSLAGTPTPAKAQEVETSKALKETLTAQEKSQEKIVDFQQVRKSGEERNNLPEILLGLNCTEQYLESHNRIAPFLQNGATVTGAQLLDSLSISSETPRWMYSFIEINDEIFLDLSDLSPNTRIHILEGDNFEYIENEKKYRIYGEVVFSVYDQNRLLDGARGVGVGKKFVVNNDTINYDQNLIVDMRNQPGEGTLGLNTILEITSLNGSSWLDYISEDGLYQGLTFSDDPSEPIENVRVSELLQKLDEVGAYKETVENNGIKETKYQIGIHCSTKNSYFPNISTKPYTLIIREEIVNYGTTVENYNTTQVETPRYYNESSVVSKDSLEVGKTYQVKLEAKDGFEITKVIINGEERALGNGMVDFVAKKENTLSIDSKELLQYVAITENYDGNQVESPRYYEGEVEIHKEKLEIGKTYQVRLKAKDGFEITKVIINGEEKVLENGMVDFVAKKENTLEVQSEVTSGIEDKEIKNPRISSENGVLTVDTQDSTIKSVQIYTLGGQLLHQRMNLKGSESFVLTPGVYIVKYGSDAVKLVVR